jgi:hypothetical protein
MAGHIGRQFLGAGLKAKADYATELVVPNPEGAKRQFRHDAPVAQRQRAALTRKAVEERVAIGAQCSELF